MCKQDVHQNTLHDIFLAAAHFISPNSTNPAPFKLVVLLLWERMVGLPYHSPRVEIEELDGRNAARGGGAHAPSTARVPGAWRSLSVRLDEFGDLIRASLNRGLLASARQLASDVLGCIVLPLPAGVRPPHGVGVAAATPLALMPGINTIQAGLADGAQEGTGHQAGGRTVCTGCRASTHRFRNTASKKCARTAILARKSVHEVPSIPKKVSTKFFGLHEKCAQSATFQKKVCTKCVMS